MIYLAVLHRKEYLFAYPMILSMSGPISVKDVAARVVAETLVRFTKSTADELRKQGVEPRDLFQLRFADIQGYSCQQCREAAGRVSGCERCPLKLDSEERFSVSEGGDRALVVCEWTAEAQKLFDEGRERTFDAHHSLSDFESDSRRYVQ